MRKTAFQALIGGLLHCERRPFASALYVARFSTGYGVPAAKRHACIRSDVEQLGGEVSLARVGQERNYPLAVVFRALGYRKCRRKCRS